MYNPETGQVSETRDVTWLKRMYYTTAGADSNNVEPGIVLELESSDENEMKMKLTIMMMTHPLQKPRRVKKNYQRQIMQLRLLSG